MATKIKAKALQTLAWDYKKGENNNRTTHTINEKPWAVVSVNQTEKKTDYEFKEDSFSIDILNGTGYIASNGDKWLLLTLHWDSAKELIDLSIKDWNSDKWELNKEKTDELIDAWKTDGCLTAIKCNGFAQLELMAETLKNISFEYRDCPINLTLTTEDLNSDVKDAFNWYIEEQITTGDEVTVSRTEKDKARIKKFKAVKDNGLQVTLNLSDPTDWVDYLVPFEFAETEEGEANYPYLKVEWTPPVIQEYKGSGKGGYGGNSVSVTETTPKDRLAFCYEFTGTNTPQDLVNADTKLVCTALLLSGAVLSDAYIDLLRSFKVDKAVEIPTSASNKKDTSNTVQVSSPENSTNGNSTNKNNVVIAKEDYSYLINEWATANPNKLPPDLDLSSKSDSWKRMFYSCITGSIGEKPLLGTAGRKNQVAIKKDYGMSLHELNEEQLGEVCAQLDSINVESDDLAALPY